MHRAAQKIREWRRTRKPRLTQAAFALEIGISPTMVHRIETGALPHGDVMNTIVRAGICEPADWFETIEVAA